MHILNIDDAVMVLRSLAQTSPKFDDQLITRALMDSTAKKKVRSEAPHAVASVATYDEPGGALILSLLPQSAIGTARAVGDQ